MINKKLLWSEKFPVLFIRGKDVRKFLNGQLSTNVLNIPDNKIHTSCLLDPLGNLTAVLEISFSKDCARLISISGDINLLSSYFSNMIFPSDNVDLEPIKYILRQQVIDYNDSWRKIFPYYQFDNKFHENTLLENYEKASKEQLILWKNSQGIIDITSDNIGKYNPFEIGLSDLIDFNKGCFLGQEKLSRLNRANYLRQEIRSWETLDTSSSDINYTEIDLFISSKDQVKIGNIISSIYVNNSIHGFAFIKRNFLNIQKVFSKQLGDIKLNIPIGFVPNIT
tara:strand:+ start:5301 stop:6143 length:843 start_codon:yes stop_codon:yes gene_type:complete